MAATASNVLIAVRVILKRQQGAFKQEQKQQQRDSAAAAFTNYWQTSKSQCAKKKENKLIWGRGLCLRQLI